MTNPFLIQAPEPLDLGVFLQRNRHLLMSGYVPLHFFGSAEGYIYAVLGKYGSIEVFSCRFPAAGSYPALTPEFPAFSMFERLLYEEYEVLPEGHPWLKAVRNTLPGQAAHQDYPFLSSNSSALHEVGVGPVHAGVIEPGHFRFICKGETVQHLEIQLGYQHRGVEALMLQGDILSKTALAECIAGDTAIGHSLAYCLCLEGLSASAAAALPIRNIALEMERVAMHLADLSALAADIAYIMGQNLFAALRTTVINSSLAICGSRFGKRWLCPGGVNYGIDEAQASILLATLKTAKAQIINSAEAMFADVSVLSRLDDTGILKSEAALAFSCTGITAKASALVVDARMDFPLQDTNFLPLCESSGDVYARAYLRYREILQSLQIIFDELAHLDFAAPLYRELQAFRADSIVLSIVEGWRGRIVHIAKTDASAKVIWYKVLDPSLINWQGLALAMRGVGISDFPICNKSFDLSYCGSDL